MSGSALICQINIFCIVNLALLTRGFPKGESTRSVLLPLAWVIHKRANVGPLVRPARSGKQRRTFMHDNKDITLFLKQYVLFRTMC